MEERLPQEVLCLGTDLARPTDLEAQRNRMIRLAVTLTSGLPTLPSYIFQLDELLMSDSIDLERVATVISRDPSLSAQIIRLCNFGLAGPHLVSNIREAVAALGTERIRKLVLTCSLLQRDSQQMVSGYLESFWFHSICTAAVSERLAAQTGCERPPDAYLAGLMHDIGYFALLVALSTEKMEVEPPIAESDGSLEAEQLLFGIDHCTAGAWIGKSWNFSAPLIDVIQYHHRPDKAKRNQELVNIVAAADQYSERHGIKRWISPCPMYRPEVEDDGEFFQSRFPSFTADQAMWLANELQGELQSLLLSPGLGIPGACRL